MTYFWWHLWCSLCTKILLLLSNLNVFYFFSYGQDFKYYLKRTCKNGPPSPGLGVRGKGFQSFAIKSVVWSLFTQAFLRLQWVCSSPGSVRALQFVSHLEKVFSFVKCFLCVSTETLCFLFPSGGGMGMELRTLHMLGKCSSTEQHAQPVTGSCP